jgi:uncharacterized membrane protein YhaH (DUF805 family)
MEQKQPQPPVFNPQQPAQQPAPQYQPRVTASPMMDPVTAVKTCFKKYCDFKGRARRSEFWWFMLFVIVVSTVISYFGMILPGVGYVSLAFSLAVLIPELAVLCRRLHDANHGSWWVALMALLVAGYYGSFISMVGSNYNDLISSSDVTDVMGVAREMANSVQASPGLATAMSLCAMGALVLGIILIVFTVKDSYWRENKYGPSPKY